MNEEALTQLDQIEFILRQYSEGEHSDILEDIGYMTESRRQELNSKNDAISAFNEIKKYFYGQRTLTSDKADKLMSIIDKYFIDKGDHMFVINVVLPFRLNYLP